MIDIHSHILPDLDDGPDTISQSLRIAKEAFFQGVQTIFATPHLMNGVFQSTPKDITAKCSLLTNELIKKNIPIQILPGSEIRLTHDTVSLFDKGRLMTLNNMDDYLLLELPPMFITEGVIHIIRQFLERGIITIIAHPERNASIIKSPNIISKLIYEGTMMQITATSLMGSFGKRTMGLCEKMIDRAAVSFIGSDIHPGRTYRMKQAYEKTCKIAGKKEAEKIFLVNPGKIMDSTEKGINYV